MTPRDDVERIEFVLRTMILWIAKTAGSPLSAREATELLTMLDRPERKKDERA